MTSGAVLRLGFAAALAMSFVSELSHAQPLDPAPPTRPVIVAVLDSGVDMSHPALRRLLLPGYNLGDCEPDAPRPCTDAQFRDAQDHLGHGTMVAGLVAEGQRDQLRILPIKINRGMMDDFSPAVLAAAIDRARTDGAAVINLSIEMPALVKSEREQVGQAIDRALEAGILVVVAVGNRTGGPHFPAGHPGVVSVGGVDATGRPYGIDLPRKGASILANAYTSRALGLGGSEHLRRSGTSVAAPRVSGALAALLAADPCMSAADAVFWLLAGSDQLADGSSTWKVLNQERLP